jgi:hypothetical protein
MSKALVTGSRTRADLSGKRFHHDQSTSAWPIRCSILPNEIEWQTFAAFPPGAFFEIVRPMEKSCTY